ncbi:AMP-binding enzyme domain-containing protein [Phthorimaea operculella]|nr:AMP-binding enzyme domain-containing protein [Phthorimaea operculella]
MKTNPNEICLINGLTGVTLSNQQMLHRAVPLARALIARQMSGRTLLPIMRNTEHLVALYYAAMFAGVKIFLIDPLSTRTEVDYFLPLVEPSLIVCDADRLDDVKDAVKTYGKLSDDALLTTENLSQFVSGQDTDPTKFNPVEVDPEACGVMLPTSGSTGMPKVAELQYIALLAHLPTLWGACTRFPRPTERVLFLSTAQWMTFTTLLTCCPVFGITLIITYDKTISKVINIIETYKPTWLLLAPFAGLQLSDTAQPEQLVSLEIITLGGAPAPNSTVQALEALAPNAKIRGSYGMTEAQGWIAFYTKDTPLGSLGKPFNIFQYKLVDENNEVVKQPGISGELYIKGPTTIKKYLKNEKAHREMMTADGWLKTGDIFTEDEDHNLFFVERKSFWFKCVVTMYHISPEEFEGVIKAVDGVMEVVVVGTERGAAAGVVRRPGSNVTREDIHQAIENSPIDPHKRLRGGIAFVDSLPHTHSGKLHRANCKRLIAITFLSKSAVHNFKTRSLNYSKSFFLQMSFAIQRGKATAAQRYLDAQLQSAAAATARPVTLPDLIYYCMKSNPAEICLINGLSGVSLTNWQVLQRAVPLARALASRQMSGQVLLPIMRNTEHLVALYYGALFAGVKLFLVDPLSTQTELDHFLSLVEPSMIVCDGYRLDDVRAAVLKYGKLDNDALLTTEDLDNFTSGHDSDPAKFETVAVSPEACAVMLPTSGSTGLPKVAELSYEGLVAQLPSIWGRYTDFTRPTERVMFMSTAQWVTFTLLLTTCPVFGITLIITYDKTVSKVIEVIDKYRPTWLLQAPFSGVELSESAKPEQLASLETITFAGAPPPLTMLRRISTLAPKALVCTSYGMTETHSWIMWPTKDTPLGSVGKVFNIFQYKLVDENNEIVDPGEKGELYVKGKTIIKAYLKNEKAHREMMTDDGWLKTGDIFTEDEDHNLYFVERKTFWFKCVVTMYHISPEEFETVIKGVDGVMECVVAGSERGAAAAVVRRPGSTVSRENIEKAIENSSIDPHKRLRGGIAFVESLPQTHSGKLHRADCKRLIASLIEAGECFI